MIIAEDFKLNYGELIKATGEHAAPAGTAHAAAASPAPSAPAAPASPPGGEHAPKPTGAAAQPRQGHRYVKRWWDGGKWQYEYPGEGSQQHQGQGHFGEHEKREHTLELPEVHNYGPGHEEQAYKETLGAAFAPGAKHEVPSPTEGGKPLNLSVKKNGDIVVEGVARPFKSHGAYEKWYRALQQGPEEYAANGKPMFKIVPNVGKLVEGVLHPSTEQGGRRSWKMEIADDADPKLVEAFKKSPNARGDLFYPTRDAAKASAAEKLRYLQETAGAQVNWGGGEQPTVGRTIAHGAEAPPEGGAPQPKQRDMLKQQALARESREPLIREMGEYGWTEAPDPESRQMVQQFAGPPEVKNQLVQKIADQFAPQVFSSVKEMTASDDPQVKDYWQQRILGDAPIPKEAHEGVGGSGFVPQPGTPIHNAISRLVDNYDARLTDGKGNQLGLAAYVGKRLRYEVMHEAQRMHAQQPGSLEVQSPGGETRNLAETGQVSPEATEGTSYEGGEEAPIDMENWRRMQEARLYQLNKEKQLPEGFLQGALKYIKQGVKTPDDIDHFAGVLHKYGHGDYALQKALFKALCAVAYEMKKAAAGSPFISRDKGLDPSHQYSHMEGDKDHPKYFFRDASGNFIRYTNAPTGHTDASSRFGDPKIHPAEPDLKTSPQFFDQHGRKLTRAPYPGAEIQWNPNYHAHDPENLWVGRWVNPITGEHEHTYVDADMRMIPKMFIHQMNVLVDVRLPVLRKYYRTLFSSPMLKDKIVAVALALIDQGRFRAQELTMLTPRDVKDLGAIYQIGNRLIYADQKLRSMLQLMTKNRTPDEPLFAVPFVKKNGEVDDTLLRRIGPHFLQCSFDQIGISLSGLQTYHATQTFSRECQRLLAESQVPWDSAVEYATVAVAEEMGHDLTQEPDMEQALPLIRELMIDPVVIDVLKRNAKALDLVGKAPVVLPLPPPAVHYVSMDLETRTADETDFSKWLHSYPMHMHAEFENFVRPPSPTESGLPGNPANGPDSTPPQPEADPQAGTVSAPNPQQRQEMEAAGL